MENIVKKGLGITLVYLIAIFCTLLMTHRVNELNDQEGLRNTNKSISIKLSR